jgi:hypothetical protein
MLATFVLDATSITNNSLATGASDIDVLTVRRERDPVGIIRRFDSAEVFQVRHGIHVNVIVQPRINPERFAVG